MADSIDRVFVHALNTVKRIPRLGSARPPPAERLKLYGLYKQSMEGNVDGVMDRPSSDSGSNPSNRRSSSTEKENGGTSNDELRADQQKWDAWNAQKGLSRTDAKRRYITTLIDTMRVYASQTADARELVAELEFVWDQIKDNPPSSSDKSHSSGRSHSDSNPNSASSPSSRKHPGGSGHSSSEAAIYPLMSERGSRNPQSGGTRKRGRETAVQVEGTDDRGLRVLSPMSQGEGPEDSEGDEDDEGVAKERRGYGEEDDTEELEGDDFVDAPDSQIADGDRGSQNYDSSNGDDQHPPESPTKAPARLQQPRNAASAIIEPIAKYLQGQRQPARTNGAAGESNVRWQRRIESALVKMNAEMAALREHLDMQQQQGTAGSVYSIVNPFSTSRRNSHASGVAPFGTGSGGPFGRGRRSITAWLLESLSRFAGVLVRHLIVDALLLALVTLWFHYRGIPPERLEELISSWIRRVRALAVFKKLDKVRKSEKSLNLGATLRRMAPGA